MKIQSAFVASLLLVACSQSAINTEAIPPPKAVSAPAIPGEPTAGNAATSGSGASASGTVEAINPVSGQITLAHGAVSALNWPPMTMAFKATPEQMASVHVGQKVDFDFVAKGMDATISRIAVK